MTVKARVERWPQGTVLVLPPEVAHLPEFQPGKIVELPLPGDRNGAKAADTDVETADTDVEANDKANDSDKDAHGDAVSAVAKSDATAAHGDGENSVNHGGAVSAVAQKH